jgi:AraC-like DNA-binding protein
MIETDTYRRVVNAKIYIDKNYCEPINLEQISQQAYFSKFHFHRLFTHIYQITPHDYLTLKRLHHAKLLLQQEGLNVRDVCNSVGFESLTSFSLLFKKRNGFAPQYYRNLAYLKKKLAQEQPKRFIPHCMLQQMGIEDSKNQ